MKVTAVIEMWDDKTISVYVPEFDGFSLSGQGKSVDEAYVRYMNVSKIMLPCLKNKAKTFLNHWLI